MTEPLWTPAPDRTAAANMTRFRAFVKKKHGLALASYAALYRWSVEDIPAFWAAVWDFLEIRASIPYEAVVDDLARFPGAEWFPGARLNMAENLLRYRDDRVAFVFKGETTASRTMTYAELYAEVARVAGDLAVRCDMRCGGRGGGRRGGGRRHSW